MRLHFLCYLEASKPVIADFQTGQSAASVVGWETNCESLSSSLPSAFPLVKDRSNPSYCFTCTDTSHFALTDFAFILF